MTSPPPPPPSIAPALFGYRVYRAVLLVIYLGFVGLGTWAFLSGLRPEQGGPQMGLAIAAMGLVFTTLCAVTFFFPHAPWAYSGHMALICLGIAACVTAPFGMFLVYAWLSPEMRAYFQTAPGD